MMHDGDNYEPINLHSGLVVSKYASVSRDES